MENKFSHNKMAEQNKEEVEKTRRTFLKTALVSGGGLLIGTGPLRGMELARFVPHEKAETLDDVFKVIPRDHLEKSVLQGCHWLVNLAQIQQKQPNGSECNPSYAYQDWQGAMRNDYIPGGKWRLFGTIWHTGQAVKSLALAYRYFNRPDLLESARKGAAFILNQQQTDKGDEDYGMILGYENDLDKINTSCVLECCDGLFTLAEVTGEMLYADQAMNAINWVVRRMYAGNGCFADGYSPEERTLHNPWPNKFNDNGRPLLDDGVLLRAWKYSGDENLRRIFYEVADHLLEREGPEGNWIGYVPCNWKEGYIHPRHAYWWGRPMWMAYKENQKSKYRKCFDRACTWYTKAMRHDGGIIRNTYADFNTLSFGHACSGSSCAAIMFRDAFTELGDPKYIPFIIRGLSFAMSMQVTQPRDRWMDGVIIEQCLPPNGKDAVPWGVRDIATTFFVSAATQVLLDTQREK